MASALVVSALATTQTLAGVAIRGGPVDSGRVAGPAFFLAPTYGTANESGMAIGDYPIYSNGTYLGNRITRRTPSATQFLNAFSYANSGASSSAGYGINASGAIVGMSAKYTAAGVNLGGRPVRWDAESFEPIALGALGTGSPQSALGQAWDINDLGTSVGAVTKYTGSEKTYAGMRPVRWNAGGVKATELDAISTAASGLHNGSALAINQAGATVGYGETYRTGTSDSLGERAVRWAADSTTATALGTLGTDASGHTNVVAFNVNAANTIIGSADKYDTAGKAMGSRGVRWMPNSTAAIELLPLGTKADGSGLSQAFDQNDAGVIVGRADRYNADGTSRGRRAVRWNAGSNAAIELGSLGESSSGITNSFAIHLNAGGLSVGRASVYTTNGVSLGDSAVMWNAQGAARDLNTLLPANSPWKLVEANDISNSGWISGSGTYHVEAFQDNQPFGRDFTMLVPQAGTYGIGDANFDGKISFDDLMILAQNYNKPNASVSGYVADFDLNGQTNFDDLIVLAQHYNQAGAPAMSAAGFASDWALAQSLVPEPFACVVLLAATPLLRRRRRDFYEL